MAIRISGLNSGLDTEAMVSELVSAYRLKEQKYEKAQKKLSWKQDAWKSLNTKVKNMYDNISNLRFTSAWSSKKTTISDATKATITASGSAVDGTHRLKIKKLAKGSYITGGKLENASADTTVGKLLGKVSGQTTSTSITGAALTDVIPAGKDQTTTTLQDLGFLGTTAEIKIKDKDGNEVGTFSVSQSTTINDFVNQLSGAHSNIDAHFSITDKIVVQGKNIDDDHGFGFTLDDGGAGVLDKLGLTEGSGATIVNAQDGTSSAFSTLKVKDSTGKVVKSISVTDSSTISGIVRELNTIDNISASYDAVNQRIFLASSKTGKENAFTLDGSEEVLRALGLNTSGGAAVEEAQDSEIELDGAIFTSDTNKYSINGLSIDCMAVTGDSEISITTSRDTQAMYDQIRDFFSPYNSLMEEMYKLYNADSAKGYEPLTSEEKDAMSDTEVEEWEKKIKSALLRRDDTLDGIMNAMRNSLTTSYYVYHGSAITYDSKNRYYKCNGEALKDANGTNITSQTALTAWANANGVKKYSLSSFGIKTEAYASLTQSTTKYSYHIDGDADDSTSKNNTDVLMNMLNSDPDMVVGFMKQAVSDLYSAIDGKMKSVKGLSSAYTIYNDIEMAQEYSDYTDTIKKWEEKVSDIEESYYKKFAAMESALASLQSQSSSLTSMLS